MHKLVARLTGQRLYEELHGHYLRAILTRGYAPTTLASRHSEVKHLLRAWQGMPIKKIRPHHVAAALRSVADAGLETTAYNLLWAARDIFNEALLMGWLMDNPAKHVEPPRRRVRRQRMTLAQWHQVDQYGRHVLPAWFAPAWTLALVTGQRASDLVRMRFDHVEDGHLHVEQFKTGARVALPLALRLDAIDTTLGAAIEACRHYHAPDGPTLLRSPRSGKPITAKSLSNRATESLDGVDLTVAEGTRPTLHEVRSLSERLYRAQGIDTKTLLGHKHQSMTDAYNDDRGLTKARYKRLVL